ncbi:MAG: hypothetical protein HY284_03390, partial [Nitrospirae bacterium]|nr:hypothetical protein [Nitrospirota bacterium]
PSPPSRAKLHISRYEALSLEPDHAVRLNVYFVNRGDAGALDVFIVSRMRFIKPAKSVASLKEEEDAVFNEIQAEMKSSKNKIVSSTMAGSERWFTIDGPALEKSDFQIPNGSKEREIARDGSLLIVAGTIKYRDKTIHRKTEFCGYMIKVGAILSCMRHNIED